MPEFTNAYSGQHYDRKLTHEELVRAIRFMIAAEYEAIQLYEQLAENTDNKLAQEVLLDIAGEEKEHAGEFLRLLHEIQPNEIEFYDEGAEEVEDMIAELKKSPNKKIPGPAQRKPAEDDSDKNTKPMSKAVSKPAAKAPAGKTAAKPAAKAPAKPTAGK